MNTKSKEPAKSEKLSVGPEGLVSDAPKEKKKEDRFATYGRSIFETKDADVDSMLEQYGLNWEVRKEQLFIKDGGGILIPARDHFATVRMDKMEVLGTCSGDYKVSQNSDLINVVRPLLDKEDLKIVEAGELRGGKLIYTLLEMPAHISVGGDEVRSYIFAGTSHDRSRKLHFGLTNVRVICENTFNMAMDDADIRIAHTKNMHDRLFEATQVLNMTNDLQKNLEKIFNKMATTKVNDTTINTAVDYMLNIKPNTPNEQISTRKLNLGSALKESIHREFKSHKAANGTVWGLHNGFTAFYNHYNFDINDVKARKEYIFAGGGNAEMKKAMDYCKGLITITK